MRFNLNLSVITLLLLITLGNPVYGQVVAKDQVYEWNDFSGGLVTKLSPFSLNKTQGDRIENIRFNKELSSLNKRDPIVTFLTPDATEPILGLFRLYLADGTKRTITNHGDEIESCVDSTSTCSTILTVSSLPRQSF